MASISTSIHSTDCDTGGFVVSPASIHLCHRILRESEAIIRNLGTLGLSEEDCQKIYNDLKVRGLLLFNEHAPKISRKITGYPFSLYWNSSNVYCNIKSENDDSLPMGGMKMAKPAISLFTGARYKRLVPCLESIQVEELLAGLRSEWGFLETLKGCRGVAQVEGFFEREKGDPDGCVSISIYEQEYRLGDLAIHLDNLSFLHKWQIAEDLIYGLDNIHKKEIVHCDIKPRNIFLDQLEDGRTQAVIGDFDLALWLDPNPDCDIDVDGPFAIFSPEKARVFWQLDDEPQLRWDSADEQRSDVWALGKVLYRLFAEHFEPLRRGVIGNYFGRNDEGLQVKFLVSLSAQEPFFPEPPLPLSLPRLIFGMLQVDPVRRLTAAQALNLWNEIKQNEMPPDERKM